MANDQEFQRPQRLGRSTPSFTNLGNVADVIPGYSEKVAFARVRGGLKIVQARDLDSNGRVRWEHLDRCGQKAGSDRARVVSGDILLTVRAADPRAILVEDAPAGVVAGATFAIVRCRATSIDVPYLHWLLESDGTRQRLRAALRGSAMPFLSVVDLARFELPVPPLPTQRAIARVDALRQRLAILTERLDGALGHLLEGTAHSPPS